MRIAAIALAAAALPGLLAPVAAAAPADTPPPYIDHVTWAKWGDLSSLRVYPTPAARRASGHAGTQPLAQAAWNEVLTLSPDAAIPGMWEQFLCHWNLAEFAQPGKTSWNLEPWRPEVSYEEMVAKRCNPGGTEEPF
ncbi:DUF2599 domain-containing protein [Mycolicibacterium parafortuitum]|uniref:DUF2599 domain-containing protein n=1 Tax=Mycolicibacterium parafortuitum TaxID=39692 RepID=A0A375YFM2_MYCPF|nr:DUF2599 domain-containing protein [Mycolicibacterium parafortuitum]ORB31346.1 hypothetical protein BST38_04945 [Mycolicibacterium parafortuitum]PQE01591.1 DUF2599 domain-containing protein [Mycobacterium sp. EPG1]SRX79915.1 hypothetical protein MPP7335_01653 [Mycolicibacterium parafortuitum]